jgi:hypothetical protein
MHVSEASIKNLKGRAMKSTNEAMLCRASDIQVAQPRRARMEPRLKAGMPEYAGKTIQEKINLFNQPVKFDRKKIRMLLVDDNIHDVVRLRDILHKIECWPLTLTGGRTSNTPWKNIGYNAYDFCMIDLDLVLKEDRLILSG